MSLRFVSKAVACLLLVAWAVTMHSSFAQEVRPPKPGILFTGKKLGIPPQTGTVWKQPENELPRETITTIQRLLDYGFADPRGCEYREIEVTCGNVWSNKGQLVTTHGWVLPQSADEEARGERFAVTWSGLVYPVSNVGAPANFQADVENLLKQQQPPLVRHSERIAEEYLVSYESAIPVKGCVLCILGHAELGQKLWKLAPPLFGVARTKVPDKAAHDPYVTLVRDWAWADFDRAVCAHLRGDDVVALASATRLVDVRDFVEEDAPARDFVQPLDSDRKPKLFLEFLDTIDTLAEDAARRVASLRAIPAQPSEVEPKLDQAQRIAALIVDLESVNETQWGQPGGVSLNASPIVKALVNEGAAAVEPLLKCLQNDQRLTRSVSFHRDFFPRRNFLTVEQAAFEALRGILKATTFGPKTEHGYRYGLPRPDDEERKAIVTEVRDYWNKTKGSSDGERWFITLADPQATESQWLEAARNVTRPVVREKLAASRGAKAPLIEADLATKPMLQGEELRTRKNPGVSELLIERANELTTRDLNSTLRIHHLHAACEMTLCLATWDLGESLPEIRRRIQQCRELNKDQFYRRYAQQLNETVSRMIVTAVDAGEKDFLTDYEVWIREQIPDNQAMHRPFEMFRPLSRYADEPRMIRLAEELFSEGSAWRRIDELWGIFGADGISSPMVGIPAFRELLKTLLEDRTVVGTTTLDLENTLLRVTLNLKSFRGATNQSIQTALEPDEANVGDAKHFRMCDLIAWKLSSLRGAPLYELYWTEAKRNEVIPRFGKYLDQWGDAFRDRAASTEPFVNPFGAAAFHLAKLDRAATPNDVAAGRAVFTLIESGHEARQADLPTFPQPAKWTTLKDFPIESAGPIDPQTGKPTRIKSFDQNGLIWQAEEVQTDGRWQRFYGFVGRHIIAKVPAVEIEFVEQP